LYSEQSGSKFVEKNASKWEDIIRITPSLHNFSSGAGSNFGLKDDNVALDIEQSHISNCFKILDSIKYKFEIKKINITEVVNFSFVKSIFIFATTEKSKCEHHSGLDHWMCCVDHDHESYLLACSCTMLSYSGNYKAIERKSDKLSRYYNNKIEKSRFKKRTVNEDSIYRVTLINSTD
jgi:hypothetical protein